MSQHAHIRQEKCRASTHVNGHTILPTKRSVFAEQNNKQQTHTVMMSVATIHATEQATTQFVVEECFRHAWQARYKWHREMRKSEQYNALNTATKYTWHSHALCVT